MPQPLVIVESPAKAKTISSFLGSGYLVESSIGHIRDLPRSAADVPAAYKAEPWARLGVDVDNGFKPLYVVAKEKRDQVRRLEQLVKQASEVYLATDEDREGESIAWHLLEVLAPKVPVKRMVFHEITRAAIERAIADPRELDRRLVDAQEARRILDRLYGYEVSPVLWKKVARGLSAGRVQSVATRVVVERERERMTFRSATWWGIEGRFVAASGELVAALTDLAGRRIATGEDFTESGELREGSDALLLGADAASEVVAGLDGATAAVALVEQRPYRRSPAAPFITSTLQQEAARKLHFSAQRTMSVAQRLYEQGHITYMRTDSTTLSATAIDAARAEAVARYGADQVPGRPRTYDRKVKNAQEAHEAIRPAGDRFTDPTRLGPGLGRDEQRLYELVFQRTVASQMIDATGSTARVRIEAAVTRPSAGADAGQVAGFGATGTVISSPGFLRVYREGTDEPDDDRNDEQRRLPQLRVGDELVIEELSPEVHATKPPARYTEASLVRKLEELGVGRPSTYASILSTIQDRGYVWKRGTALVPSFTAFAVVGLLEQYFSPLVDYSFTARMEDDLDAIASGAEESIPWLERFYFGAPEHARLGSDGRDLDPERRGLAAGGLRRSVLDQLGEIDAREVNSIPIATGAGGEPIVVRVGRYGPYLQSGEARAPLPEQLAPDELTAERAAELLAARSGDRELGVDPTTGETVTVRVGRYGPYVQRGDASGGAKPATASLFKQMLVESVTLEEALRLLELPRTVGTHPDTGEEIVAANGRYGPYLRMGKDSRSLSSEEALFEVTLEEAVTLFSQPKPRRFGAAASAGTELGPDPETGATITLRAGRFGPYVTDGTTNASLRRGDEPESLDLARAAELLAERRAAGPRPPRRTAASSSRASGSTPSAARKPAAKKPAAKGKATAKRAVSSRAAVSKVGSSRGASKRTAATTTSQADAVEARGTSPLEQSES